MQQFDLLVQLCTQLNGLNKLSSTFRDYTPKKHDLTPLKQHTESYIEHVAELCNKLFDDIVSELKSGSAKKYSDIFRVMAIDGEYTGLLFFSQSDVYEDGNVYPTSPSINFYFDGDGNDEKEIWITASTNSYSKWIDLNVFAPVLIVPEDFVEAYAQYKTWRGIR